MIEQCEKCKHKEILNGGIVGCLYMGADCCKGEMFSPITNAGRIRSMSDEEIAKIFTSAVADGCPPKMDWECAKDEYGWDACDACWCKWLKQPVKDGEG